MGLFSSKKTVKVASTVYNLAGPEEDRPNFLKSNMFASVIKDDGSSLGESITGNYLYGPGIDQRSFFKYCQRVNFVGLPTLSSKKTQKVDPRSILPHLTTPLGTETIVREAFTTVGDYAPFVDEYILNTYPELYDTEHVSEYNPDTHEFTIQYASGNTEVISAGSFDPDKSYVVAYYDNVLLEEIGEPVLATPPTLEEDPNLLPDLTDYSLMEVTDNGSTAVTINNTVTETRSYSNSTPTTVTPTTTSIPTVYTSFDKTYEKIVYEGGDGVDIDTKSIKHTLLVSETRELVYETRTVSNETFTVDGVTTTVLITTEEGFLRPRYTYQVETQEIILGANFDHTQVFIYEVGGLIPELNSLFVETENTKDYFPTLPIRVNNVSIKHPMYSDTGDGLYPLTSKAYKKATKAKFSELVDIIEDNPNLGEIDYACVHFGVSLNTQEKSCLKYVYKYFQYLITKQNFSKFDPADFVVTIADYDAYVVELQAWAEAQNNIYSPLYQTPQPTTAGMIKEPKVHTVQLVSDNVTTRFANMQLSWIDIDEEVLPGLGKVGAKKGDLWFEDAGAHTWKSLRFGGESGNRPIVTSNGADITKLFWQVEDDSYKVLIITGMQHRNFVYGADSVLISSNEAIADIDESGFIVPLHYPTMRSMSLVDSTQMSTANMFVVFNSYKIYKQKWYERGIFKILLVIAIVVITFYISPATLATASGILGSNVAVGAAIGFTGSTAILAGAIANALAAVVVSMIISRGATELFGEKWGAIVGAVLSFATGAVMAGGGFANFNFSDLLTPKNLLGMSSALANGYSGFVQGLAVEIGEKMEANQTAYDKEMDKIDKMLRELTGVNDLSFDPLLLTDIGAGNGQSFSGSYVPETVDEFIHRATLTGSDIVNVTLSLITDYADLNLTLPE